METKKIENAGKQQVQGLQQPKQFSAKKIMPSTWFMRKTDGAIGGQDGAPATKNERKATKFSKKGEIAAAKGNMEKAALHYYRAYELTNESKYKVFAEAYANFVSYTEGKLVHPSTPKDRLVDFISKSALVVFAPTAVLGFLQVLPLSFAAGGILLGAALFMISFGISAD